MNQTAPSVEGANVLADQAQEAMAEIATCVYEMAGGKA
jgi:hypothetical protein